MVPEGKSITFEEFYYILQEKYGSKELAPKTYSRYVGMLKSRILPYLGSFPLDKIKPTDLIYVHPLQKNMRKAAYVLQDLLINNNDD